jgi:hypothetical protein
MLIFRPAYSGFKRSLYSILFFLKPKPVVGDIWCFEDYSSPNPFKDVSAGLVKILGVQDGYVQWVIVTPRGTRLEKGPTGPSSSGILTFKSMYDKIDVVTDTE